MHFQGHLHLRAAPGSKGGTRLAHQSFRAPFHISKPYEDAGVLQLQIVNPTAGILEGDRLDMLVKVDAAASLCVSTPSAARVFRTSHGNMAQSRLEIEVEEGAWLEYSPEPLYPHAGSEFDQGVVIHAGKGAGLWYMDCLAPGRAARGELWAWKRLISTLELRVEGRTVLRERLAAEGAEIGRLAAFHGFTEAWLATVLLVFPNGGPSADWWEPVRALHGPGLSCGLTRLRPGGAWVLRLAAASSPLLREALARVRMHAGEQLPGLRTTLRR